MQDRVPNKSELQAALKIFDKKHTGAVDANELKDVLTTIGDPLQIREVKKFENT